MGEFEGEQLVITNRLCELKRIHRWTQSVSDRMDLSSRTAFHLDLVLAEAVTNIISYAYNDNVERAIRVRLADESDSIVVELIDDGNPFNPLTKELPKHSSDLETVTVGGWGIQLIKSYTQNQTYRYEDGKNILKLGIPKQYQH